MRVARARCSLPYGIPRLTHFVTAYTLTTNYGRRIFALLAITIAVPLQPGGAQGYYNLDAGRPGRVEDASPTARYELELQLLPVRVERFASGATRWRSDPKLSFGVAPFTELELRVPLLMVDSRSGTGRTAGAGGLAVGALHALTLETGALPALAVAGEWIAPVGGLSAHVGSYSAKVIGTKTLERVRVHVNVGYGTWSVRPSPAPAVSCPTVIVAGLVVPPECGRVIPIVPDTPCDRVGGGAMFACVGRVSALENSSEEGMSAASVALTNPASVGYRWVSGVGVDHAFPLASTLVSADVVAERFIGLYDTIDWSADVGLRHQWTPTFVVDLGIGRHFAGAVVSNAVTMGITYGAPRQSLRTRSDP
jgi:hypothetical protein